MKNIPKTSFIASLMAIAVVSMMTAPAFAASITVSPTYSSSQMEEVESFGCGTQCNADWNSNGVNNLYADASDNDFGADGPHSSTVRTHHKSGAITYSPTLSTTVTTVEVQADIDFDGNIDYGTGSQVDHHTGAELYLKINGSWTKVKSCLHKIVGGGTYDDRFTKSCSYSNAGGGTKEYRVGTTQISGAYSTWLAPDTRADFDTGAYYSEIEQMKVCENTC